MGRKIDMKKIQDVTKCQVTFSKRRSSLIKKANEIAVCCDVDVIFLAFSPSGRISKFCNQKKIEDVLQRYINLPADERLTDIDNVQEKLEKLKNLSHIKSDSSKLHFLDKQIENLELQIRKAGLEMQILEADIRDYEITQEQKPSLHQLTWCERNLTHSLEKILARKNELIGNMSAPNKQPVFQFGQMDQMELANQGGSTFPSNFNENELASTVQNSSNFLMKLDPWISPYSSRVRQTLLQDLTDPGKCTSNFMDIPGPSNVHNSPTQSNICNFPFQNSPGILESGIKSTPDTYIPFQQSSVVDQAALNFADKNIVDGWDNFPPVPVSDVNHTSTLGLSNFQSPRFMSTGKATTNASTMEMAQSLYDDMENCLQFTNSYFNQFNNMEGQAISQFYKGESSRANCNEMQLTDLVQAPYQCLPENEVAQETLFDYLPPEGTLGENAVGTSEIQKSGLWEWEDLLLDKDFIADLMN